MAVIALASTAGQPGTTTTALCMALLWPRPVVVVEATLAGGSGILADWFGGEKPHDRGLVNLAVSVRQGTLNQDLVREMMPLEKGKRQRMLIPDLRDTRAAHMLDALWDPLASALSDLERTGTDVIIDAGRLGMAHGPVPLLTRADTVIVVTRSTLRDIAAVANRIPQVRDLLMPAGDPEMLRLLLIGEQEYTKRELRFLGTPVVGVIAYDPKNASQVTEKNAAIFTSEFGRLKAYGLRRAAHTLATSRLIKSTTKVVVEVETMIKERREMLTSA